MPVRLGRGGRPEAGALGPAGLIHRLVQVQGDMEPVQHLQRVAHLGGEHIQVRPPQVAADKAQSAHHLGPQRRQSLAQRGLGPFAADPQQPPALTVNLVNDRQKTIRPLVFTPVNLIHPDGLDARKLPVGQPPLDEPLHRTIPTVPTGLEGLGGLPPGQMPRPPGQKAHHRPRAGHIANGWPSFTPLRWICHFWMLSAMPRQSRSSHNRAPDRLR